MRKPRGRFRPASQGAFGAPENILPQNLHRDHVPRVPTLLLAPCIHSESIHRTPTMFRLGSGGLEPAATEKDSAVRATSESPGSRGTLHMPRLWARG